MLIGTTLFPISSSIISTRNDLFVASPLIDTENLTKGLDNEISVRVDGPRVGSTTSATSWVSADDGLSGDGKVLGGVDCWIG